MDQRLREPQGSIARVPTVSILLCNYNDAEYLPYSLAAICSQTRPADEVIVLDDGSTDNSMDIINNFAQRYPFVRVLRNNQNRGLIYSINRALHEAQGEFFAWAAADDILLPEFLEHSLQYLSRWPQAGLVFSQLAVFRHGPEDIATFTKQQHGKAMDFGSEASFLSPDALRRRLRSSYLWMSGNTALAHRETVIEAGGFDGALRWHADWFTFWVAGLRRGVCLIPATLAALRQRETTYSSPSHHNNPVQCATLAAIADKLTSSGWRDIGWIVLRYPCLLSPFGLLMLRVLLRRPRRWPFAVTYGLWMANHMLVRQGHWRLLVNPRRGMAKVRARMQRANETSDAGTTG